MKTPLKIILLSIILLSVVLTIFLLGLYVGSNRPSLPSPETSFLPPLTLEHKIMNKIVAVDNAGKGVAANLVTEIRPGTGLVLVNINNTLADLNTQYGAKLATLVAKNYTQRDLSNVDIIFNIQTNANVVGGPSAGSTMAVATIAALLNKTLRDDVVLTGSVLEDGRIGDVGGLKEKAKAAKSVNATLFLVPEGYGSEIKEHKRTKNCGAYEELTYCKIRYVEDYTNIGEELGLQVIEVKTVEEALRYYF